MKKIRHHINENQKVYYGISFFLLLFSALLIYLDYNNAQKVYDSIKTIDEEKLMMESAPIVTVLDTLKELDYITDVSLTKFVNNEVSFEQLDYVPEDLVSISSDYVFDSKGYSTLRTSANDSLQKLAEDFYLEFGRKLTVVSAYRSYSYQKGIKDRGCPDNLCAKAGYSEHQTGFAVDIFAASTQADWEANPTYMEYFEWFKNNAYKYGFHNTYQRGVEIDGYEIEPWHWRFLGIDLAEYLWENDMTFAEFYKELKG